MGCGDVVVGHGGIVFEGNGGIVVGSGTPGNVVPCRLWEHKYFMKENKTSGRRSKSRDRQRQRQRAEGSSYKIMVRTFHSFQFQENELMVLKLLLVGQNIIYIFKINEQHYHHCDIQCIDITYFINYLSL